MTDRMITNMPPLASRENDTFMTWYEEVCA
jgi:hypothetical protein